MDDLKEVEKDENIEFRVNDKNIYESEEPEKISIKDISINIETNNNIMNYINSDIERMCELDIQPRKPNKKYLGIIEKRRKENIIKYLKNNNYHDSGCLLSFFILLMMKNFIFISING